MVKVVYKCVNDIITDECILKAIIIIIIIRRRRRRKFIMRTSQTLSMNQRCGQSWCDIQAHFFSKKNTSTVSKFVRISYV